MTFVTISHSTYFGMTMGSLVHVFVLQLEDPWFEQPIR